MARTSKRTTRIQIYLTPHSAADKPILDLWNACLETERPQELFRSILKAGLRALYEEGEIPPDLVRKAKLDRHFRNVPRQTGPAPGQAPFIMQMPYPAQVRYPPQPTTPYDEDVEPYVEPPQRTAPRPESAPETGAAVLDRVETSTPEPEFASSDDGDTDDVLALFGKNKRKA